MDWINVKERQPATEGKYLVKTKTTMGNVNRFDALLYINNTKITWDVNNQVVTHWLEEE